MQHHPAEVAGSRVQIDYRVDLHYDIDGDADFIFLIHPARTPHQEVLSESLSLAPPVSHSLETDPVTGNRLLKLQAGRGALDITLEARIEVHHHMAEPAHVEAVAPAALPASTLRYLTASRYCQTDQLQAKAWQLFGHLPRGYGQVQAVTEWVRDNIEFRVGTSNPGTSAIDTLGQRLRRLPRLRASGDRVLPLAQLPGPVHDGRRLWCGRRRSVRPTSTRTPRSTSIAGTCSTRPASRPTTGLIRIATGQDAADVSFATIFGPVRTGMPRVVFSAVDDPAAGIALPRATSLAVSTARHLSVL